LRFWESKYLKWFKEYINICFGYKTSPFPKYFKIYLLLKTVDIEIVYEEKRIRSNFGNE
jgi:hypothetical protein